MDNTKYQIKHETANSDLGDVSGNSFAHYMIYANGKFVKDVYSFEELQQYYDRYFLYGKITHERV